MTKDRTDHDNPEATIHLQRDDTFSPTMDLANLTSFSFQTWQLVDICTPRTERMGWMAMEILRKGCEGKWPQNLYAWIHNTIGQQKNINSSYAKRDTMVMTTTPHKRLLAIILKYTPFNIKQRRWRRRGRGRWKRVKARPWRGQPVCSQ